MRPFQHLTDFVYWLQSEDAPDPTIQPVFVCVENSNLQNTQFRDSKTIGEAERKGRDVGKNQAVSAEVVYACEQRYTGRVIALSPREKGEKINQVYFLGLIRSNDETLLSAVAPGESGQDCRDAYKLALLAEQQRGPRQIR
jgi:hypothetical protein